MSKVVYKNESEHFYRNYTCPAETCGHTFSYRHASKKDLGPRFCPRCGYDTQGDDAQQLDMTFSKPLLGKVITVAADNTYRAMEEGAAHRAQVAMEQHGLSQEEANNLKITDLRTNNVEGENSVKEVDNPVTDAMRAGPNVTGFQPAAAAAEFARSAHVGPHAHAGARAVGKIQETHMQNVAAVVAAGRRA